MGGKEVNYKLKYISIIIAIWILFNSIVAKGPWDVGTQ